MKHLAVGGVVCLRANMGACAVSCKACWQLIMRASALTPSHVTLGQSLLSLVENTTHDSFELYYGLFLYNPVRCVQHTDSPQVPAVCGGTGFRVAAAVC